MSSEFKEHSISFSQLDHAKTTAEYVSAFFGTVSGGLSEALMIPIRRNIEKRIKGLEDVIVEDIRNGKLPGNIVVEEDLMAGFVLRVMRAATEGVAKEKLRLMSRLFFKELSRDDFDDTTLQDYWAITEQLNKNDIKIIAIVKRADQEGLFDNNPEDDDARKAIVYSLDEQKIFEDKRSFNEAAIGLLRFGLVDCVAAWDSLRIFATDRCIRYVRSLDFSVND